MLSSTETGMANTRTKSPHGRCSRFERWSSFSCCDIGIENGSDMLSHNVIELVSQLC